MPLIVVASVVEFLLTNSKRPQNFILGELVNGDELSFIVENLPKDGTGCPGWWLFDEMMRHFGASVTTIQGNWTYGDNLATANALTVGDVMSLEDAASQTPTGRYAMTWGFSTVKVLPQTIGVPGNFTRVHVLFTR